MLLTGEAGFFIMADQVFRERTNTHLVLLSSFQGTVCCVLVQWCGDFVSEDPEVTEIGFSRKK